MTSDTVLIVGGGPVGLTLACELFRHGVPCRIVDKQPQRHNQSRATDIQAGTLRIFEDMGVLPAFLEAGKNRDELAMFTQGELVAQMTVRELDTTYPFALGIGQSESERLLEAHLNHLGGRLERGVAANWVAPDADGVDVGLEADGVTATERFDWVVGCDGAHSGVRKSVGLALDGSTMADHFFLADVDYVSDRSDREISLWTGSNGALIVLPIPGTVRVFGDLDGAANSEPTLRWVRETVRARTHGAGEVTGMGWAATFKVHARIVERYRKGRVLLAGDAAHIHSPVGGHGMNTGVHDAYNLGWKLALVARGAADARLLDSYDAERRPAGRAVVTETDLQTRASTLRNAALSTLTGAAIKLAMKMSPLRRRMMVHALELDIAYPNSPWVGELRPAVTSAHLLGSDETEEPCLGQWRAFGAGPGPGAAAPDVRVGTQRMFQVLAGPHHTLLLFDGEAATAEGYARMNNVAAAVQEAYGPHVRTLCVIPEGRAAPIEGEVLVDPTGAAHEAFGAGAECAYLIRPDGHVGYRAQPADAQGILAHLHRVFRGAP